MTIRLCGTTNLTAKRRMPQNGPASAAAAKQRSSVRAAGGTRILQRSKTVICTLQQSIMPTAIRAAKPAGTAAVFAQQVCLNKPTAILKCAASCRRASACHYKLSDNVNVVTSNIHIDGYGKEEQSENVATPFIEANDPYEEFNTYGMHGTSRNTSSISTVLKPAAPISAERPACRNICC